MKKALWIFGLVLPLVFLSACGNKKPENTSDAMYQIGLNAVQAADDYIAGKLSGEEAYAKIEEYTSQANAQYNREIQDTNADTLVNTEFSNDTFILFDISSLSYQIMSAKHGSGAMSEVRKSRDKLAESLGK